VLRPKKARTARQRKAARFVGAPSATLRSQLREALAQQDATAEVLRVIAQSPARLDRVFEIILANAARLCAA